jgi:uncharacterized protein with PIN domain
MLGRLARWLRMLGLDTLFLPETSDQSLLERAVSERRILLTRDRALAKRVPKGNILLVRSEKYLEQLKQVMQEVRPRLSPGDFFSLCTDCNERVRRLASRQAAKILPARTLAENDLFWKCPKCGKVLWQGSHSRNALQTLRQINASG